MRLIHAIHRATNQHIIILSTNDTDDADLSLERALPHYPSNFTGVIHDLHLSGRYPHRAPTTPDWPTDRGLPIDIPLTTDPQ